MSAVSPSLPRVKLLHTSDWHIGRTFHGHATLDAIREALAGIPAIVRERDVDAVLVSGDVFDSATPSAAAIEVLREAIRGIREAGAVVVASSGNHDSATRLGFMSEWARLAGVHVRTDAALVDEPVVLHDEHGEALVYAVPYLEPALVRHLAPGAELRSQADALAWAIGRVEADRARRGGARAVVLSHCFASAAAAREEAGDVERDITSGGLDVVPTELFSSFDYAALGHIHGRAALTEGARYSGAPLHYSFSEAGKPRGAWLATLGADGLDEVEWVDLPVPRPLRVLRGGLDELLADGAHEGARGAWVKAELTDPVRPLDAMRRLQARFPYCAAIEFAPVRADAGDERSYAVRVASAQTDAELVDGFLAHVRGGAGASPGERDLVRRALARVDAEGTAR